MTAPNTPNAPGLPNIEAFAKKVNQDSGLQKRIEVLQSQAPQEAIAELVLLSTEAGTPVSEAEWLTSFERNPSGKLSDGDLEAISGGASNSLVDFLKRFFVVDEHPF